jgi:hypothetical protein
MSLSSMSSREKIVVAVLGVVILLALVGIGILAANLVSRTDEEEIAGEVEGQPAGSTQETSLPGASAEAGTQEAAVDITPVATPVLEEPPPPVRDAAGGEVIVRQEGVGGLAPVVIANQALQPGRLYRIEIQAVDGSQVVVQGSWSQAAVGAGGTLSAPALEFFEGQTPYRIDLALPLADATRWSCSVSAAIKGAQLSGPALAIEILDVTGSQ